MALFIISRSPFEREDYKTTLRLAGMSEGSAVVLIQDGVVAAESAPPAFRQMVGQAEARGVKFYALSEDLAARGVIPRSGVRVISMRELVDLIFEHGKVY